jgi:ADP-heptose:LPS heptosyltransferase
MAKPKHVVVIRLSAMGDVAMVVPVLQTLTASYPTLKITVVSRAFLKPLFTDIPNVSFFSADVKGRHKGLLGLYRLFKELKGLQVEALADLHNVLRSKILRFFFGFTHVKKAVIDKGRAEKKALTRSKNKVFKALKKTPQRYADVFESLGYPVDLNRHKFPEKEKPTKKVSAFLQDIQAGFNKDILIGIAPFAQHRSKMYPLDLMKKVITTLAKSPHLKMLFFGGSAQEKEQIEKLIKDIPNTFNVIGVLNFADEINLIAQLKLMLSMDSGNAHLAAIKNVKTITLWGVTHPFSGFIPFKHSLNDCLLPDLDKYPKLPNSVYGNKIIAGYEDCMRSIPHEMVVKKILDNLKFKL